MTFVNLRAPTCAVYTARFALPGCDVPVPLQRSDPHFVQQRWKSFSSSQRRRSVLMCSAAAPTTAHPERRPGEKKGALWQHTSHQPILIAEMEVYRKENHAQLSSASNNGDCLTISRDDLALAKMFMCFFMLLKVLWKKCDLLQCVCTQRIKPPRKGRKSRPSNH